MLPGSEAAQRLLQFVGHVSADENSFAIGHLFSMSPYEKRSNEPASSLRGSKASAIESKSVSRILCSDFRFQIQNSRFEISNLILESEIGVTIIPLAQPLPVGSSNLPGGRSKPGISNYKFKIPEMHWAGSPFDASLFGLAPRGVCLAARVTTHAGALLL